MSAKVDAQRASQSSRRVFQGGEEGARSWGNSHRASMAPTERAGVPLLIFVPLGIDSYVGRRRKMTRGRQPRSGMI